MENYSCRTTTKEAFPRLFFSFSFLGVAQPQTHLAVWQPNLWTSESLGCFFFVGEESTEERGGVVVLNLLYKLPQYKGEAVQRCLIYNCPLLRCLRCNSSGWSCQSLMDTQQQSHGRRWFVFPCLPFEPCTVWTTRIKNIHAFTPVTSFLPLCWQYGKIKSHYRIIICLLTHKRHRYLAAEALIDSLSPTEMR